jgi:hypothetical protein
METPTPMKISKYLALGLLVVSLTPVFGQPTATPQALIFPPQAPSPAMPRLFPTRLQVEADAPVLTKFNLDFPGGTPAQLVKAIEKASSKPLNAIIPDEDADVQLPPLKMNNVVVPQLFAALEAASIKTVAFRSQYATSYSQFTGGYGFKTADGPASDTSIWYFRVEKPSLPPMVSTDKVCQFYSLDTYLNRGFTVDDITTAIQTGWKMAGITPTPELNYHKETKLLIAFGETKDLDTISRVLQTLPSSAQPQDVFYLKLHVEQLQKQFEQLDKKISATATNSAPEEKSGK